MFSVPQRSQTNAQKLTKWDQCTSKTETKINSKLRTSSMTMEPQRPENSLKTLNTKKPSSPKLKLIQFRCINKQSKHKTIITLNRTITKQSKNSSLYNKNSWSIRSASLLRASTTMKRSIKLLYKSRNNILNKMKMTNSEILSKLSKQPNRCISTASQYLCRNKTLPKRLSNINSR